MSDLKEVYNGTGDLMIKMTSLGGNQKAFLPPRGEDPTVSSLVNSRWSFGLMAKAWKQADFAAEAAKEKELQLGLKCKRNCFFCWVQFNQLSWWFTRFAIAKITRTFKLELKGVDSVEYLGVYSY